MREFITIVAALLAYDLIKVVSGAIARWWQRTADPAPSYHARPASSINPPDHW